jgi:hypothetical protein
VVHNQYIQIFFSQHAVFTETLQSNMYDIETSKIILKNTACFPRTVKKSRINLPNAQFSTFADSDCVNNL